MYLRSVTPALFGLCAAAPALAQDETAPPPPVTFAAGATVVSDDRVRGVSQSDGRPAVAGTLSIAHESGLYAGVRGATRRGWGDFADAGVELDLNGGYRFQPSSAATLDLGLTYRSYPGGADATDYFEPYAKLSGTYGPLTLLAGVAYAPPQEALGRAGGGEDNLYLWGDATAGVPTTPLTLRAHIGRSSGNPGLNRYGWSLAPTGTYWDWSLGVEANFRRLTLGLAYVDTDISRGESAYLQPFFSRGRDGTGSIAGGTLVGSLTVSF
jgi:uncharacterized protein (TIGR02001 family)